MSGRIWDYAPRPLQGKHHAKPAIPGKTLRWSRPPTCRPFAMSFLCSGGRCWFIYSAPHAMPLELVLVERFARIDADKCRGRCNHLRMTLISWITFAIAVLGAGLGLFNTWQGW